MDIQKKQATWNQERPLFELNFMHSHLLEYFSFNESTGDYELVEVTPNFVARDVVYEVLNTGWAMWLRAKCNAKSQAVPEKTCSIQGHEIIINETKNELINDYDIAKEDEYLLEALVYRGVCIGKSQAVPEGRTDIQIIEQTIGIVRLIGESNSFECANSKVFPFESKSPRLQVWWRVACEIQELLTDTDPNNCDFEEYKAMIEAQEQSHD